MEKENISKAKILDKIRQYEKTGKSCATMFLDPREIFEYKSIYDRVPYYLDGGFEDAERKILVVGQEEKDDEYIAILKVTSNKKLSHREVLGSVLGTGIKRDVVGDIVVSDNIANVYLLKEISKYVIQNLDKVGREKVKVSQIKEKDRLVVEDNSKEINTTVPSLRLDAIISATFGISRELSSELIKNAKVNVDYKEVLNSAKQLKEGDLISVRGYGRFILEKIIGETRKARIRVHIRTYS